MSGWSAVAVVVLVAGTYLVLIRIVDPNEREPLWALSLFFGLGWLTGILAHLSLPSELLYLRVLPGAVALESTRFIAISLGLFVITAVERWRGWPEIDGVVDGLVYGAATGLGTVTGGFMVLQLLFAEVFLLGSPFSQLWSMALLGLSGGLFGAIIGGGFGWARSRLTRGNSLWLSGAIGLVLAIGTHTLYRLLTQPAIGSGASGLLRAWVGMILPLGLVVGATLWGLTRERTAIEALLEDESEGLVADHDRVALQNVWLRRRRYLSLFWRGRFDEWQLEKSLHNKQVKLALMKRTVDSAPSDSMASPNAVEAVRGAIRSDQEALADVRAGEGR